MLAFKVTTVGASSGVILTKEAMARLRVKKGDTLFLTEAPDGGYRLTPYDPEFARQMALAEEIMHDDREVLRALARAMEPARPRHRQRTSSCPLDRPLPAG